MATTPHQSPAPNLPSSIRLVLALAGVAVLGSPVFAQGVLEVTERLSESAAGMEGDAGGGHPSVSADGRFVAFESASTNLVPGDTNGASDIFVVDRLLGTIERVSVDSAGVQANGASQLPSISADGGRVIFESTASNLVTGDSNGLSDIFVHDRLLGQTLRVSVDSAGVQGNGHSHDAKISGDGGTAVFWSFATNLDPPDGTPFFGDVFTHDLATGVTTMESVSSAGVQGNLASIDPAVSFDGTVLAFESFASNLVAGDTNNHVDIFVRDRSSGHHRAGQHQLERRPGHRLQPRVGDLCGRLDRRLLELGLEPRRR